MDVKAHGRRHSEARLKGPEYPMVFLNLHATKCSQSSNPRSGASRATLPKSKMLVRLLAEEGRHE